MEKNSTIVAISTAQGCAGIGVIRISGPDAIKIADKIFVANSNIKLKDKKGYSATLGKVIDNKTDIDEAIAIVFKEPHSYTGENVVEISCHGGTYVTKKTLQLALENGAKISPPGEFTKRAFLNGKMNLTEAEAVMEIINANNKQRARTAINLMKGTLYRKIQELKQRLIDIQSHIQVWVDYPDEDIEEIKEDKLLQSLIKIKEELHHQLEQYEKNMIVKEGIDTAILGRPNVGKSTLMNMLIGHERSIVTEIPGTTRDIIEESVTLGGVVLKISDTAGIHNTNDTVEKIGVNKARSKIKSSQIIFLVFDSSKECTENDIVLMQELKDTSTIAILNKIDLDRKFNDEILRKNFKYVIETSAKKEQGLEEIIEAIKKITEINNFEPMQDIIFTERQRESIIKSKKNITEAIEAINEGVNLDAIGVLIEQAIQEMLEITGEKASDVVLDNVFSKFCIGK